MCLIIALTMSPGVDCPAPPSASFVVLVMKADIRINLQTAGRAEVSKCAEAGVAAKPKKGDALFFYSQTPSNQLDEKSLHAGCPVIRGDKWSATKWMRVGKYEAGWIPRKGLEKKPQDIDSL